MSRVLIIEDEALLRSSMARGLGKLPGIEVFEAGSMAEAVRLLDAAPPNLVLSDIDLPDRSGIEIFGELGKRSLAVPVVLISAYLKAYGPQIPRHANVEVHEKPVGLEDLRKIVLRRLDVVERPLDSSPFTPADFLQLACMGKHSVVIERKSGGRTTASLVVKDGQVWAAQDEGGIGFEAFRRIIFSPATKGKVECRTLAGEPGEPNVVGGWQELLMNAARLEDEAARSDRLSSSPPSAPAPGTPGPSTGDGFDEVWEEGVSALLGRNLPMALHAFLRAGAIRPGDRRVEANVNRLREMGVTLDTKRP